MVFWCCVFLVELFHVIGFQSTGSFFHDTSITLGSLIGVSSILELSRRSARGRTAETSRDRRNYKPKPWLFSLCSKLTTDAVNGSNAPSLRHFLEAERRTASVYRRNIQSPTIYGPSDFSPPTLPVSDTNTLFVGGQVAPLGESGGRKSNNELLDGNGYGAPLLFSCLRGSLIKWWFPSLNQHSLIYAFLGNQATFRLHLFQGGFCVSRQAATLTNNSALNC